MIEVLAAIALAGNILEFTRLGISLLHDTRELYKSAKGSLSVNDQLELITIDLEAFVAKLREPNPGTTIETSFQALLTETQCVAKELLDRLEGLKSKDSRGKKWESFRKKRCNKSELLNLTVFRSQSFSLDNSIVIVTVDQKSTV